jgi:phospholipase D-like protein/putative oligomerization/nucleic acid binding protein
MTPPVAGARLTKTAACPRSNREAQSMLLAADYPFLDVLWTMLVFFLWIAWFWLVILIVIDIFRRRDAGGGKKVLWLVFILFVPFLGVFIYLIANSDDMAKRRAEEMQTAQAQTDEYIRTVASSSGPTAEIERAKGLLDTGAITQAEFDAIKAKALA